MEKNKKKYLYYSGNFKNISKLRSLTNNPRHAQLLDQFAFWSINSTFVLPGEEKPNGWFCIKYKEIAEIIGYSKRRIEDLIPMFKKKGLIEQVVTYLSNQTRSCIRLTRKTLSLLGFINTEEDKTKSNYKINSPYGITSIPLDFSESISKTNPQWRSNQPLPLASQSVNEYKTVCSFILLSTNTFINHESKLEKSSINQSKWIKNKTHKKNLIQGCGSTPPKIAAPYNEYKGDFLNSLSNITICNTNHEEKPNQLPFLLQLPSEYQEICNEIGELLTDREKNYIISMLENTFSQHNVKHSGDKGELFAEITFSILNKEHMPFAEKFEHRVNIIAKKLRQKQWKTPKGFSKYWDIGREITQKRQARLTKAHAEKVNSAVEDSHSILAKAVSGTKQDHRLSTENAIDRFQHGFEGGQYQWKIEKDLTEFKKEKASILVKMRTIQSEIKLLNSLIDNPQFEQQKTQHVAKVNDYKEQLTTFNNELWAIETKMKALLDTPVKETYSEEGEGGYRALYEEAC